MDLGEKASNQPKTQPMAPENMQWAKVTTYEEEPNFKIALALSPGTNNVDGSPTSSDAELGLLAMSYGSMKGWITKKLGPKSGHWKRLAREAKANPNHKGKSPICQKREGPISLQELDPDVSDWKRRKGRKQKNQTLDEETQKVGGVVVAAEQRCQAK